MTLTCQLKKGDSRRPTTTHLIFFNSFMWLLGLNERNMPISLMSLHFTCWPILHAKTDASVIILFLNTEEVAKLNANEWYFFSFRDRKYATGFRTNRATTTGYWKATGKDRMVVDPGTGEIVGMRKTLVFYRNRAPNGIKTGWIMHEFRLETPHMPPKVFSQSYFCSVPTVLA